MKTRTVITFPGPAYIPRALAVPLPFLWFAWLITNPPQDVPTAFLFLVSEIFTIILTFKLFDAETGGIVVEKRDVELRKVAPGLWQGGLLDSKFNFDEYDLDVVVDLRTDSERPDTVVKVPIGKEYIRWPMIDREIPDPDALMALGRYLATRASNSSKVGVFCNMGINRSGLLATATAQCLRGETERLARETQERLFNPEFLAYTNRVDREEVVEAARRRAQATNERVQAAHERILATIAQNEAALEAGQTYLQKMVQRKPSEDVEESTASFEDEKSMASSGSLVDVA